MVVARAIRPFVDRNAKRSVSVQCVATASAEAIQRVGQKRRAKGGQRGHVECWLSFVSRLPMSTHVDRVVRALCALNSALSVSHMPISQTFTSGGQPGAEIHPS